jgi:hypothetical protein
MMPELDQWVVMAIDDVNRLLGQAVFAGDYFAHDGLSCYEYMTALDYKILVRFDGFPVMDIGATELMVFVTKGEL